MKLVSTLAYFIKNGHQKFFKQPQPPQSAPPLVPNSQTSQKFFKSDVDAQVPNIQMESSGININKLHLKQKKPVVSDTRKSFFTKRRQQQRLGQAAQDPSIIKNVVKTAAQSPQLSRLIKVTQLPMELFAIHRQYCHQFTPKNYEHLFVKLHFSTQHPETVLHYVRKKKGSVNQQSDQVEKEVKLMTKEEMINHAQWKDIIQEIMNKMQGVKDIATLNTYLLTFMDIQKSFGFTPAEIYQYILARNALANFQELTKDQVSNLIHFLKYNNRLKLTNGYQYDANQLGQNQSVKIDTFLQRIGSEIINNPEIYTKIDFLNVFIVVNRRKKRMNILTQELLAKSQVSILKYCHEFSFENIYTYMKIYIFFHRSPNKELLGTLMAHLYQKCLSESNQYSLLIVLHSIKHRELIFKNLKEIGTIEQSIHLQAGSLAVRLAQVLSKKMKFKPTQILQFLSCCFQNDISDEQVLMVISSELTRQSHEFSLQKLAKGLFKLHLLGGKSESLIKKVMDEYACRYKDQMVKLTKDETFSAPTQSIDSFGSSLNFKQIHLQQCLIMLIWTANQYNDCRTVSEGLKSIYPSKVESMDPLVIELIQNINQKSSQHKSVRKIVYKFVPNVFPEGRLAEFYRHQSTKGQMEMLMWEQASLTNKFIANYNIGARKFLPQRWSSASVYKIEDYVSFCLQVSNQSCFFDQQTMLSPEFLKRRQKIIKRFTESQQVSQCFSSSSLDKII